MFRSLIKATHVERHCDNQEIREQETASAALRGDPVRSGRVG
jgi:hypothetical protein